MSCLLLSVARGRRHESAFRKRDVDPDIGQMMHLLSSLCISELSVPVCIYVVSVMYLGFSAFLYWLLLSFLQGS